MPRPKNELTRDQRERLLEALRVRFEANIDRHRGLDWADVRARLDDRPGVLASLHAMERTGGEPDVVGRRERTGGYVFFDCAAESPPGRRSLCYDEGALEARKQDKPQGSALGMAAQMGIEILTEEQYRSLQGLGRFDERTSSWIATPGDIRELGGALFADRRYGHVFVYHNGAASYYAARGFRGSLRV